MMRPCFKQTLEGAADGMLAGIGETDALRTAAPGDDRGVNADDLALQIDQRSAAIPRINRGIRLQKIARNHPTRFGLPFELIMPSVTVSSRTERISDG